jgi:hypothetical protein
VKTKPRWQFFLTPEERANVVRADRLKAEWRKANALRNLAMNRANSRAQHAKANGR